MASKFAEGNNILFPHRQAAIDFLDGMLAHKFFHRAKKVPVSEQELNRGKSKKKDVEKEKDETKDAKDGKKKDEKTTDGESNAEGKSEGHEKDKEKRKRKIRLDMHPEQIFVDGHEAYVWIYDPIPIHYWILGILIVIGAILICLFPLWPPSLRKGVYYLSIAAAGFLVLILGLAVVRAIVFAIVWLFTGGKHHFWIFPNLTEDVGFFASFQPLYHHEYRPSGTSNGKDKKPKRRKKDKDSDAEDDDRKPLIDQQIEEVEEENATAVGEGGGGVEDGERPDVPSESESESSQQSASSKEFVMIDKEEAENQST